MCRLSKKLRDGLLSPWLTGPLLMPILGLAAYLRLAYVGHNPGWYTDEATHLLIGQQLLNGRSQYFARYVFDPHYQNARFIIIDNLWRNWGIPNVPTLAAITQDIETNWALVYHSGAITVYANPKK